MCKERKRKRSRAQARIAFCAASLPRQASGFSSAVGPCLHRRSIYFSSELRWRNRPLFTNKQQHLVPSLAHSLRTESTKLRCSAKVGTALARTLASASRFPPSTTRQHTVTHDLPASWLPNIARQLTSSYQWKINPPFGGGD